MGGVAAISLTLLLSGAAPAEHLRLWAQDLDECCAPKAVEALGGLPAVSAVALELSEGALCLSLARPAAEALPQITAALAAVAVPVLRTAPADACPTPGPTDPWGGPVAGDFERIPSSKPFSIKSALVPGKATILDFGAAWCAPCHTVAGRLKAALGADPALAVRAVVLEGADATASFATPVAKQHLSEVPGLPWMMVFSPRGRLVYAGEDPDKALAAAAGAR